MGVLTNKDILEEISGKVSFQIAKLLEAVFPTLGDEEKKAIMTVISAVAPEWEKTPFPDLIKYQVPLYHIGRRKQELLTQLPKDYLRTEWPDEWRYLQEKERELKKAEVHEPFRTYSKSGWSAHSINSMKAMKVEDMLGAFRKYNTNATGIDEKPTRQGECTNFQTIVTQNPEKYVPYIDAILKDSSIHREYAAYGIIGLIQLDKGYVDEVDMTPEEAMDCYAHYAKEALELMIRKNHDYDEAWRSMRVSSYTDFILTKLQRVKEIEDLGGETLVSEGIDSNYMDIINYSVFGAIKMKDEG
jgi:hypothetical protein